VGTRATLALPAARAGQSLSTDDAG